ncbi:dual specificity protein phosphatase 22-B-like [Tachypleus tridentatus]|uniref:dual specificity protein phosphatase 22-B-like n=1 Tax=Tachypleus tridentatus TaxID=6853 RepID=UPI003FCF20B8
MVWTKLFRAYTWKLPGPKDENQLVANNITHVLSIHDNAKAIHKDKEYLCIIASDTPNQNINQFFSRCNDFIHNARLNGGNVLVHCLAGVSRSVTIAAAYVMSVTSLNHKDALKSVRGARSIANPNFGFQKQLHDFEQRRLKVERKRLQQKYPNYNLGSDENECQKLLVAYHNSIRPLEPCPEIRRSDPTAHSRKHRTPGQENVRPS